MRTAPPAAVAGRPARRRCTSPRALALRVVPLHFEFDEADLSASLDLGGAAALRRRIDAALVEATNGRATNDAERRVLRAWVRYEAESASERFSGPVIADPSPYTNAA